jgi:hypothetical protein
MTTYLPKCFNSSTHVTTKAPYLENVIGCLDYFGSFHDDLLIFILMTLMFIQMKQFSKRKQQNYFVNHRKERKQTLLEVNDRFQGGMDKLLMKLMTKVVENFRYF